MYVFGLYLSINDFPTESKADLHAFVDKKVAYSQSYRFNELVDEVGLGDVIVFKVQLMVDPKEV